MTRIAAVALSLLLAGSMFAQRGGGRAVGRGGYVASGPGNGFGQGNILHPSGISARPGGITNPTIRYPLGTLIPGRRDFHDRGWRGRGAAVIPVPIWGGFGWGPGYDAYVQQQQPVVVVPPQQPSPSVIINQHYTPQTANPVLREYSGDNTNLRVYEVPTAPREEGQPLARAMRPLDRTPQRVEADDKPTIYLIAQKDGTVRTAIGYWLKGGEVHYVTPRATVHHFPLAMLDAETTEQLNRERNVEWDLR